MRHYLKTLFCCLVAVFLPAVSLFAMDAASAGMEQKWAVKANYPNTGVEELDATVRQWLEKNIERHLVDSAKVLVAPGYPGGTWEMDVDYVTTSSSEHAVSFIFETVISPSGAAHPMSYVDVLSFDPEDGAVLKLEDIFAEPQTALDIFSRHAQDLVAGEVEESLPSLSDTLTDDIWFREGFAATKENYAAMALVPEGVMVVFQKYQILPYVYGHPTIVFPLELLEKAGPDRLLWEEF